MPKKINKTSVQIIIDFINENDVFKNANQITTISFDELLTKALLIEKKNIINTFKKAQVLHAMGDDMRAEQYYFKNFKLNNEKDI